MWSPSSKRMKRSVAVSPGVTGDVVVSQPVPPPMRLAVDVVVLVAGAVELVRALGAGVRAAGPGTPAPVSHTSKKPTLTVIGLPLAVEARRCPGTPSSRAARGTCR